MQQPQDLLLQDMANLNMSVSQAAVEDPDDPRSESAEAFVEERLKQGKGWVSIPAEVRLSGDQSRQAGDRAEEVVHVHLKKAHQDIPGLKIVVFNNVRLTGSTANSGGLESIREVDNVAFIEYNGVCFCKVFEIKSNTEVEKAKDRKKGGMNQLRNIKQILTNGLDIDAETIETHMVWPNLPDKEVCIACSKKKKMCKIPTFTKLPRGSLCPYTHPHPHPDPEPENFHIFRNKFQGKNFSTWLKKEVTDSEKAMTREAYEKLRSRVLVYSSGVLLDSQMKTFCVLDPDQRALVNTTEHTLRKPMGVVGLAGTGKTICVCARIERHYKNGHLSDTRKAAYIFFNKNVKNLVQRKLKHCGVQIKFVDFIDHSANEENVQNILTEKNVLDYFINKRYIKYLYWDGVEDIGIVKLNSLLEIIFNMTPDEDEVGDFWLLFDGFQSTDTEDIHSIAKDDSDQLFWTGNQIDQDKLTKGDKSGRITQLSTSFRMTQSILDHIEEKNLLPINDLPRSLKVKGTPVKKPKEIDTIDISINTQIKNAIATKIWELNQKRGIHCGYVAFLYDGENKDHLFPPKEGGLEDCLDKINDTLKSKAVQEMYAPQVTNIMDESLHYEHKEHSEKAILEAKARDHLIAKSKDILNTTQHSHQTILSDRDLIANSEEDCPRNTSQHQFDNHTETLLKCQCKVYLGSINEAKGNEARVVVYLHSVNRNRQGELEGKKGILDTAETGIQDTAEMGIQDTAEMGIQDTADMKIQDTARMGILGSAKIPEEKIPDEENIPVLKTTAYYLAASRSSCEVHILNILSTIPTQKARGKPIKINRLFWRWIDAKEILMLSAAERQELAEHAIDQLASGWNKGILSMADRQELAEKAMEQLASGLNKEELSAEPGPSKEINTPAPDVEHQLAKRFSVVTVDNNKLKMAQDLIENRKMAIWKQKVHHKIARGVDMEQMEKYLNLMSVILHLPPEQERELRANVEMLTIAQQVADSPYVVNYEMSEFESVYGFLVAVQEGGGLFSVAYAIHRLEFKLADEGERLSALEIDAIKQTYSKHQALETLKEQGLIEKINYIN